MNIISIRTKYHSLIVNNSKAINILVLIKIYIIKKINLFNYNLISIIIIKELVNYIIEVISFKLKDNHNFSKYWVMNYVRKKKRETYGILYLF